MVTVFFSFYPVGLLSVTRLWKGAFYAWLITIIVLSLVPHPPVPHDGLLGWDKFQHAGAYALLTFLGGMAFTFRRSTVGGRFLTAACLAVLVGGLMEVAQGVLTVSRSADSADLLADGVGSAVVAALACLRCSPGFTK
jgi:VanZ family protein